MGYRVQGWGRRAKLTVSYIEAGISADVENFPLVLREDDLPSEILDYDDVNHAINGGGDFRVSTDPEGDEPCAIDVVQCVVSSTSANRKAEIWTKLPNVYSDRDTTFYIWWKKDGEQLPLVDDAYGRNEVWQDYDAVYHMEEDPSGSAPQVIDYTGNGNDLSASGSMTSADSVSGIMGNAIDFDGTDDKLLKTLTSDVYNNFTLSIWTKASVSGQPDNTGIFNNDSNDDFQIATDGANNFEYNGTSDMLFGQVDTLWNHLVTTFDGTNTLIYFNGNFIDSNTSVDSEFGQYEFGVNRGGVNFYEGLIDESRISLDVHDGNYIKLEYNNQKENSTLLSKRNAENALSTENLINRKYKAKITISQSNLGISSDLADFPILIRESDLPGQFKTLYGDKSCQGDGGDIAFSTDLNGENRLPLDIDVFTITTNSADADIKMWTKVPVISGSADTDLYIWWGHDNNITSGASQPEASATYGSQEVWTGYTAVYHMNDATTTTIADSTSGGYTATKQGVNEPLEIDGFINKAQSFDGSNDDITRTSEDFGQPLSMTLQAWVSATGGDGEILSVGDDISLTMLTSTNLAGFYHYASGWHNTNTNVDIRDSGWRHVVYSIDMTTSAQEVYIDGETSASSTYGDALNYDGGDFTIGVHSNGSSRRYEGLIDEARVCNCGRSSDWIRAEYRQQKENSNVLSIGTIERNLQFPYGWKYRKEVTIDSSKIDETLYDFPLVITERNLPDNIFNDVTFKAQNDAGDIRASLGKNGSQQLPVEIREWDVTNKRAVIRVRVFEISDTEDTDVYIWWGHDETKSQPDRDSSYGSYHVWYPHSLLEYSLSENASATTLRDSTVDEQSGTGINIDASNYVNGIVGRAWNFNGSDESVSATITSDFQNITESISIQCWVNMNEVPNSVCRFICMDRTASTDAWGFGCDSQQLRFTTFGIQDYDTTSNYLTASDEWIHISVVFDSDYDCHFYMNGEFKQTVTGSSPSNVCSKDVIYISQSGQNTEFLNGIIDEIHIEHIERNASWIKATYHNEGHTLLRAEPSDDSIYENWLYKQTITIYSSAVDGEHTDFPVVLTSATIPNDVFSKALTSGQDIRITTDSSGTNEVPVEIINFDISASTEIYFKAPTLTSANDNIFYLWYGNNEATLPDASATYGSENVWNDNYDGVWHLDSSYVDSTSARNNGIADVSAPTEINGPVGKAQEFNGSSNYISLGTDINRPTSAITIEHWMNVDTSANWEASISYGHDTGSIESGVHMVFRTTGDPYHFNVVTQPSQNFSNAYFGPQPGTWYHVVGTYTSADGAKIYIDGVLNDTDSQGGAIDWSPVPLDARFGVYYDDDENNYYDGKLDEVRVSNVAKSVEYVTTTYRNQTSGNNFLSVSEENLEEDWSGKLTLTIPNNMVNGEHTDFPVVLTSATIPDVVFHDSQTSGQDIRVTTDSRGLNQVPVEIINFDVSASAEIYFKAPTLTSANDNVFYLWYDNSNTTLPASDSIYGSENVWDDNFIMIQHMNDDTTSSILDSTSNNNDGTKLGPSEPNEIDGLLGKAQDFDGTNDIIDCGNVSIHNNENYTVSLWVKGNGVGQNDQRAFSEGSSASNNPLFTIGTNNDGSDGQVEIYIRNDNGSVPVNHVGSTYEPFDDIWHKIDWVDENGSYVLYVDGLVDTTGSYTKITKSFTETSIGGVRRAGDSFLIDSNIDEIRLSNVVRTQNWLKTEYSNITSGTNFIIVSDESITSNWNKKIKLTIPSNIVNGEHTDFPVVLTSATIPNDVFVNAQTSGQDIRVTTDIGGITQVPVEVVEFATSANAEIWFKAPTLTSANDNIFYLWYDNTNANTPLPDSTYGSENVWNSNYVGVYHMNNYSDSTSYEYNGVADQATTPTQVDGKIGKAQDFETSTDDGINIGDIDEIDGITQMTISQWVNWDSLVDWSGIFTKSNGTGNRTRFELGGSGVGDNNDLLAVIASTGSNTYGYSTDNWVSTGQWFYVTIVFDGTQSGNTNRLKMFVDGIQKTLTFNGTIPSATDVNSVSAFITDDSGSSDSNCKIDEIHILNNVISQDWLKTEYSNVTSGTDFVQTELLENFPNGWTNKVKITISASSVQGVHTDFPVVLTSATIPDHVFNNSQTSGQDIRVTIDENGENQLPVEIVDFVSSAHSEIWFKAPTLTSANDNIFYLWYNNFNAILPDSNSTYGSENVWNDFVTVYHMNQDPLGIAPQVQDSTSSDHDATTGPSSLSADVIDGKIGKGYDFKNNSSFTTNLMVSAFSNGDDIQFSSWFRRTDASSDYIFAGGTSTADSNTLRIGFSTADQLRIEIAGSQDNNGGPYTDDIWHLMHVSINGSTGQRKVYVDGVEITGYTDTNTIDFDNCANMEIGMEWDSGSPSDHYVGDLDEWRVSKIIRTQEWTQTEFSNQSSGTDFLTTEVISLGIEDLTDFPSSWSYSDDIIIKPNATISDLEYFPILIRKDQLLDSMMTLGGLSACQTDGGDIRFSLDSNGDIQLPCDVVHFSQHTDPSSATAEIWVQVPYISAGTQNPIYVWWGTSDNDIQPIEFDDYGKYRVYTDDYRGVYHLNETASSANYNYKDSTQYNNHGTSKGTALLTRTQSSLIEGYSIDNEYDNNNYITLANEQNFDIIDQLTVSTFIKYDNSAVNNQAIVTKENDTYRLQRSGINNVGTFSLTYDGDIDAIGSSNINDGDWHYLVGTFDECPKYYFDGTLEGQGTSEFIQEVGTSSTIIEETGVAVDTYEEDTGGTCSDLISANNKPVTIGQNEVGSLYWDGLIDETRINHIEHTPDWIAAENRNINNPELFFDSEIEGSGIVNIPLININGSGQHGQTGSGSIILSLLSLEGSGQHGQTGSGLINVPLININGSGQHGQTGSGLINIPLINIDGFGQRGQTGSGILTIPSPIIVNGSGQRGQTGSGSIILSLLSLEGSGQHGQTGSGLINVPLINIDGSGQRGQTTDGSINIPLINIDGSGQRGQTGSGILTIPSPVIINGTGQRTHDGSGSLLLSLISLEGSGQRGQTTDGSISVPLINIDGTGQRGQTGSGILTVPSPIIIDGVAKIIRGTGDLEIPAPIVITGDGTIYPYSRDADLYLPLPLVNGTGTVFFEEQPELVVEELLEKQENEKWAYDMNKYALSKGEAFDEDAVNLSLENIISTLRGERIFAPLFGSSLPLVIFEQLDINSAETLLYELLTAIELWEDRITVIKEQVKMDIQTKENSMTLVIPYVINKNGLIGTFSKKVII